MKALEGKVAIVTGGGSGFGRVISELYATEGAKVAVSDVAEERGNETVELIKSAGGDALFVKADVGNPDDCEKLVKETVNRFGKLDIACNNAGIGGEGKPLGEYSIEVWDRVIQINLSGVFYGMRYQIPEMLKNGGGVIVNMASVLGLVGFGGSGAYVAAKHGVIGLTKNIALEYGNRNIRANAVCPGFVETNITAQLMENKECYDFLVRKHPMGRLGKVEEVVDLVLWLSGDKSSFCNGDYFAVDGGYLAK